MSMPVPRVIVFGMSGVLTRQPLEALVEAGMDVRAVVMPAPARLGGMRVDEPIRAVPVGAAASGLPQGRRVLPRLTDPRASVPGGSLLQTCAAHGIPVLEVAALAHPRVAAELRAYAADVVCVACFPWRLPDALLALPRLGAINLHPSLLPAHRGPDPLFWIFRHGDTSAGVTVHQMNARFDAGPILAQRSWPVPDGIHESQLEHQCAVAGATLMVEATRALASGTAHPQAQDEARASSESWPEARDFALDGDWPARQAFNFACGVLGRAQPLLVRLPGHVFRVDTPLRYVARATLGSLWRLTDGVLALQCAPGIFYARATPAIRP